MLRIVALGTHRIHVMSLGLLSIHYYDGDQAKARLTDDDILSKVGELVDSDLEVLESNPQFGLYTQSITF